MQSGQTGDLLALSARKLFIVIFAAVMEMLGQGNPEARDKLRRMLTVEDAVTPGRPRGTGAREIPEVPGVPVPAWWDDDHDPWADTWSVG